MSFIWLLVTHLICVFASPTPNQYSYDQLSRRNIPVIKDPSAWNPTQLTQITDGLKDACALAKAGRDAATSVSPVFLKYFPADHAPNVLKVFEATIGNDTSAGGPVQQSNSCPGLISNFSIVRDFADEEGNLSCAHPTRLAATRNEEEDKRKGEKELLMIICDLGLKLGGINKAYNSDKNKPKGPAAVNCNSIGSKITHEMITLGATILHEFMHRDGTTVASLPKIKTQDENKIDDASSEPVQGHNNTQGLSKSVLSALKTDPLAWFATQAFWTAECGRDFDEPQDGDDNNSVHGNTSNGDVPTEVPIASAPVESSPSETDTQRSSSTSETSVLSTTRNDTMPATTRKHHTSTTSKQKTSSTTSGKHLSSTTSKSGHRSTTKTNKKSHTSTSKKRPVTATHKPKDL